MAVSQFWQDTDKFRRLLKETTTTRVIMTPVSVLFGVLCSISFDG